MKNKKFDTLLTSEAEFFNKALPLCEYPRPQLVRDSYICLNGEWDFAEGYAEPECYSEKITVPYPPESLLSGIEREHDYTKNLYYRRRFTLPEGFVNGDVILHFGAVDQSCTVKLNGCELIRNEGGYHPFSVSITDALKDGENELCVTVRDELDTAYPYGKQKKKRGGMWYTPVSGIWQTVWLESIPRCGIESLKITSDTKSVKIEVKTEARLLRLTLCESGESFESENGIFKITPGDIRLWTPETPYLYYFTLESECDKVESYFALREISSAEVNGVKRLLLNGRPYLFSGLLDQGYFPDGIFTPASYKVYENDIKIAKAHGFNMLRKHIKTEPLIFYHLCDKLGMVVFQDMVNNSSYSFFRDTALPTMFMKRLPDRHIHKSKRSRELFKDGMKKTVEYLYNSPSVLYYTIFNEGWGQFCADENYRLAKSLDPTRIYDATSGWFARHESDVDSKHIYFKRAKIKEFSKRPVVLSEFGGYSYRVPGHLFGDANYGYTSCETREEFENAFFKLYREEVKPLVSAGISALVYTQISDVEDETNGIVSYDRAVSKLNASKCLDVMNELYSISGNFSTVTE